MRSKISIVVAKEWRDGWRNRWVLAITLVFACMAIGLSWFGSVAYGEIGTASLETTIASLSSLAVSFQRVVWQTRYCQTAMSKLK